MHAEVPNVRSDHSARAERRASAWRLRVVTGGLVAGAVLLLGGAGLLWSRHGATIFFDMVAAGIATCF